MGIREGGGAVVKELLAGLLDIGLEAGQEGAVAVLVGGGSKAMQTAKKRPQGEKWVPISLHRTTLCNTSFAVENARVLHPVKGHNDKHTMHGCSG